MRHFDISLGRLCLAAVAVWLMLSGLAIALEAGNSSAESEPVVPAAAQPQASSPTSAEAQKSPKKNPSRPSTAKTRSRSRWQKNAPSPHDADTADELLDLYGLEREKFALLRDRQGLEDDPDRLALLYRVLFRLPNMPLASLNRWAKPIVDLSQWDLGQQDTDSAPVRRQFYSLEGRVRRVELIKMTDNQKQLWSFGEYFRCHITLGDSDLLAIVYAHNVPKAWEVGQELNERVSFKGMFLVKGRAGAEHPMSPLLFAADRIAWHTDSLLGNAGMDMGLFDTVRSGRKLHDADRECFYQLLNAVGEIRQDTMVSNANARVLDRHASLTKRFAELQTRRVEVEGVLNTMAANDAERKKLSRELSRIERELIITKASIQTTAKGYSDFISVLEKPSTHKGRLLKFRGTALRILRVPLGSGDRDVVLRFGMDHYFEIDAIVSLDLEIQIAAPKKKVVKDASKSDGAQKDGAEKDVTQKKATGTGETANGENDTLGDGANTSPSDVAQSTDEKSKVASEATANEPEPARTFSRYPVTFCVRTLPVGMPTGPKVNEPIQIIGFHMKNWKYATMEGRGGETTYRSAPMLIGRMPLELEPTVISNPVYALIAGSLFAAALATVWLSIWILGRGDRAFEEATMSNRFALEEGVTLDRLHVPVETDPDFTALADFDSHTPDATETGTAEPDTRESDARESP